MSKPTRISFDAPKNAEVLNKLGVDQEKLAALAFEEYLEWLLGNRRPTTLSEIEVERIYKIISCASKNGFQLELNEEYLIGQLGFPVGRVRYLMSAVRKRYPKIMTSIIKEALDELRKVTPANDRIKFSIPEEIAYILRQIAKQQKWEMQNFKLSTSGYGHLTVDIAANLKPDLDKALQNYLGD